jgi:hypothetical protein
MAYAIILFVIRVDDVVLAVHRLYSGKWDGDSLLTTDHIIFAPQELYLHLALQISSTIPKSKALRVNRPNIEVLLSAP